MLHRVRLETHLKSEGKERFKVSNNYTAYYARLFKGFFKTKAVRSKSQPV